MGGSLDIVGSDLEEMFIEIERYDAFASYPSVKVEWRAISLSANDEGGVVTTGAKFSTNNPSGYSTEGTWFDYVTIFGLVF